MSLASILPKAANDYADIPAVICPAQGVLSYSSLHKQVSAFVKIIGESISSSNPLIGLCAAKSTQSLSALLAILSAGGSYIPLDAFGAPQRNKLIVQDCKPAAIILTQDWIPLFQGMLPCPTQLVPLPGGELSLLVCEWKSSIPLVPDLAFILYTSGSTGRPKGVQLTHQNALAFIQWAITAFKPKPGDVTTSIAPFHFDLSVYDIFVTLSQGASLFLIDQKSGKNPRMVAQWFEQYQVKSCYATPSFLKLLLRHGRLHKYDHSHLERVLFAGEVFDIEPLKELMAIWPQATFYNLYGPTETNVVTYYQLPTRIAADRHLPFPIGKACSDSSLKCWKDKQLSSFQPGDAGELAVAGPSVSPGYVGLPTKTHESFVTDEEGVRYYLTGDQVKMDGQKNLIFKGRNNRMIKRKGYRIELAEIELALKAHPLIVDVACTSHENMQKITAFCSLQQEADMPDVLALNQFLLAYLPHYMLPDVYLEIDVLPLTSTQKVDYQKLQEYLMQTD